MLSGQICTMSVNDDNSYLVRLLASVSIQDTVKEKADYGLLPGEGLLNEEVYVSVTTVSKKRQRTFLVFQHGEEIICKHHEI